MSAIGWNESAPSPLSDASSGDNEARSFMSSIALGLQPSIFWPGSGGGSAASAGETQPGSLRMAHSGNVTGGFENGYLSLRTEWGSVWHIGSAWTGMVGHSGMLDRGGGGSFPQSWRWLCQEGSYTTTLTSNVTHPITFPTPYTAVAPTVQVSLVIASPAFPVNVLNGSVTTLGFSSLLSHLVSAMTIAWRSEGTVAI